MNRQEIASTINRTVTDEIERLAHEQLKHHPLLSALAQFEDQADKLQDKRDITVMVDGLLKPGVFNPATLDCDKPGVASLDDAIAAIHQAVLAILEPEAVERITKRMCQPHGPKPVDMGPLVALLSSSPLFSDVIGGPKS